MENLLYQIENLNCSYTLKKEDTVLFVEKLEIPQGKFVIILGESGSGKSTLLEALALMSNTIVRAEDQKFNLYLSQKEESAKEATDITNLWATDNTKRISEIRKWHFSFIFQDTSLMPRFNFYENIYITQLIQEKIKKTDTDSYIEKVNLEKIEPTKNSSALSGGEKQRAAFVRAVSPDYSILFGDEPTGSLDETNSNMILELLKNQVREKNKSVIIVSHNIELALKYADVIILIKKNKDLNIKFVNQDCVYSKKNEEWYQNEANTPIHLSKDEIVKNITLSDETDKSQKKDNKTTDSNKLSFSKSLFWLFLKKEIFSFWNLSLFISFLITLLVFWSIGFSEGKLLVLNEQMKIPTLMQLTLPIQGTAKVVNTLEELSKQEFSIKNISGYKDRYITVNDSNNSENQLTVLIRSVNTVKDSSLVNYLTASRENLITKFSNETDAVIVTKKLLEELDYPDTAKFINFVYAKDSFLTFFPFPIYSVVNQIPGGYSIMTTEKFFMNFYNLQIIEQEKYLRIYFETKDTIFDKNIKEKIQSCTKAEKVDTIIVNKTELKDGFLIKITFVDTFSIGQLKSFFDKIKNDTIMAAYKEQLFFYVEPEYPNPITTIDLKTEYTSYNSVVINFDNYNKIRKFEEQFKNLFPNASIDYSVFAEKYAFQFASDIAEITFIIILLIGAIGVAFLFSNILANHLDKISATIGNYLAFGLEKSFLYSIYLIINLIFVIAIIFVAISLNGILSFFHELPFFDFIYTDFSLCGKKTLIAIAIIVVVSFIITLFTLRKHLNKTPGELIYHRPKHKKS